MHSRRWKFATWLLLLLAVAAWPNPPQSGQAPQKENEKKEKTKESKSERAEAAAAMPAVLWRDPGDVSSLDLTGGPGGRDKAPKPGDRFTFVKEDMNGTSTKFYVKDSSGVEWLVKVGEEVHAETAATRIVWATGYFADADYYLDSIHVDDMPKLKHGKGHKKVTSDIREVRLKLQNSKEKSIGNWSWYDNPFAGTREFNGLRVMMALINNWDLTEVNNKIYPMESEREFVVSDLGATFGKTGGPVTRSKGKADDYEHSRFILSTTPEFISFKIKSRPLPLMKPFERKNYAMRAKIETIARSVPRGDVQWISERLNQLSDQQIHDAFRAAGFSDHAVDEYAKTLEARIAQLNAEAGKPVVRASTSAPHE
ncbi:MAG TPA: hypothetical protein VFO34_03355 [Candidatus Acidoferrales bacterium]|nr:hypothetical protein [Candidatus Acidoferrales bacterium]